MLKFYSPRSQPFYLSPKDKKYYPTAEEDYGPDVEVRITLVRLGCVLWAGKHFLCGLERLLSCNAGGVALCKRWDFV